MVDLHHAAGALYVVLRDRQSPSSYGRVFSTPWAANGYCIAENALDRNYNVSHDYRIFRLIEVDCNGKPVV